MEQAPAGWSLLSDMLSAETLLTRARSFTGLHDFGSERGLRGLHELVEGLETASRLKPEGRNLISWSILHALVHRLELEHQRQESRETLRGPRRAPWIVTGLPRSGTTFLHRLLALDPNHRGLSFSELMRPFPHRSSASEPEVLARSLSLLAAQIPDLNKKHSLSSTEAEECGVLLDPSMVTPNFGLFAPTGSYETFRRSQDPRIPYQVYRELLGQIEGEDPRRLVLKAPVHLEAVGTLLHTWPELKIIVVERDPVTSLSSLLSLAKSFWEFSSEGVDELELAESLVSAQAHAVQRYRAAEPSLPKERWVRIGFTDLVGDPVTEMRRIYAHFGEDLAPERRVSLEQVRELTRRQRPGEHSYALPEGGPSAEAIRAAFPGWGAVS